MTKQDNTEDSAKERRQQRRQYLICCRRCRYVGSIKKENPQDIQHHPEIFKYTGKERTKLFSEICNYTGQIC